MLLQFCTYGRIQEERERQAQLRGPPKLNRDEAAINIQKVLNTLIYIVLYAPALYRYGGDFIKENRLL